MARVHAGVVVTVNHHDFFGNEWSYDVLVDGDDGPMTYKNMTMERDLLFPLDGVTGRVVWMAWMIRHDAGGSADADDTGCAGGLVDEDGTWGWRCGGRGNGRWFGRRELYRWHRSRVVLDGPGVLSSLVE
ncbi:hypothetical protein BMYO_0797 [Bifidobacterium myosotis]|uniref:Uncharacterized protein n=1 Tax=Bifidobacterium myosotis TaxID=1630166 RepID=A0A261FND3_9BIFI|nr:hypothetical protein [Bifidobacterium myosotis]OZG60336.1 hypothetical protein BMYO_0797 [Bifidobacterium myosotis]